MSGDSQLENLLLRTSEAATFIGVKPTTLKIWRYRGTGPPYHRIGSGPTSPVAYSLADLRAWLDEHRYLSTSAETAAREQGAA
jgi:hypothetical protein